MTTDNGQGASGPVGRKVFRLGDGVKIKTGPLQLFEGRIEGINQSKRLLKVRVSIMGRDTPVKLGFSDVEKLPTP